MHTCHGNLLHSDKRGERKTQPGNRVVGGAQQTASVGIHGERASELQVIKLISPRNEHAVGFTQQEGVIFLAIRRPRTASDCLGPPHHFPINIGSLTVRT